jgi:hypothetical protein
MVQSKGQGHAVTLRMFRQGGPRIEGPAPKADGVPRKSRDAPGCCSRPFRVDNRSGQPSAGLRYDEGPPGRPGSPRQSCRIWSGKPDSNRRPSAWEGVPWQRDQARSAESRGAFAMDQGRRGAFGQQIIVRLLSAEGGDDRGETREADRAERDRLEASAVRNASNPGPGVTPTDRGADDRSPALPGPGPAAAAAMDRSLSAMGPSWARRRPEAPPARRRTGSWSWRR